MKATPIYLCEELDVLSSVLKIYVLEIHEAIKANMEGRFLSAVLISNQVVCLTKEDRKHRQKKADVLTVNVTKQS